MAVILYAVCCILAHMHLFCVLFGSVSIVLVMYLYVCVQFLICRKCVCMRANVRSGGHGPLMHHVIMTQTVVNYLSIYLSILSMPPSLPLRISSLYPHSFSLFLLCSSIFSYFPHSPPIVSPFQSLIIFFPPSICPQPFQMLLFYPAAHKKKIFPLLLKLLSLFECRAG